MQSLLGIIELLSFLTLIRLQAVRAFLEDPFDPEPLDVAVFDILPSSSGKEISQP